MILQRHCSELSDLIAIPFFDLLCSLLYKALKLETRRIPKTGKIEDYSYIWRQNIAQDHGSDSVKNLLASAVLSTADRLCAQSPAFFNPIAQVLRAQRFKLFERIQMEVVARHPELGREAVKQKLLDKDLFNDLGVRPEYYALLEKQYSVLDESDQATILGWIEEGPDTIAIREQSGLSPEQIEQQVEYWRLERLTPIHEHLPAWWRERYEALKLRFGAPPHPAHPVVSRGPYAVSLTGFKPEKDLEVIPVDQVFEYLRTWQPPNPPTFPFSPGNSEQGLAAALQWHRPKAGRGV